MNNDEARQLLAQVLQPLREWDYAELCGLIGQVGRTYRGGWPVWDQVKVDAAWDGEIGDPVRVMAAIDDAGWRAFAPLTNDERAAIRARYETVRAEGKWTGHFAMTNADELFAEMTQSYFCANPAVPNPMHTRALNCASELLAYDPDTFALVHSIYRGTADLR